MALSACGAASDASLQTVIYQSANMDTIHAYVYNVRKKMSNYEPPKTLLFLDIETTGLKPDAQLLELSCILVRFKDLVKINDFSILVKPSAPIIDPTVWGPTAVEFHCKNGLLLDIVSKESFHEEAAFEKFVEYLGKCGLPAKSCVIAGSSVHTDVTFLKRLHKTTNVKLEWEKFSHRLLDLSTLRMMDKVNGTKFFEDKTDDSHRAMGDCLHDLGQLGKYIGNTQALIKSAKDRHTQDKIDTFEEGKDGSPVNDDRFMGTL